MSLILYSNPFSAKHTGQSHTNIFFFTPLNTDIYQKKEQESKKFCTYLVFDPHYTLQKKKKKS